MKKIKKISALFLALCLIFSLCACAKTEPEKEPDEPAISEPEPAPDDTADQPADADEPAQSGEITADGDFSADGGIKYSVSFDQRAYFFEKSDGYDRVIAVGDETGSTFIEFGYVSGKYPDQLAPSFMDAYLDYRNIEFGDPTEIGASGESGDIITASNDEYAATAYLVETANGTFTVLLFHPADSDAENTENLAGILDTLEITYF